MSEFRHDSATLCKLPAALCNGTFGVRKCAEFGPMTCRLDSSVLCILEPHLRVHWLLPHTWQLWYSQGVSLQLYYWFRGVQGGSNKVWSNCEGDTKLEIKPHELPQQYFTLLHWSNTVFDTSWLTLAQSSPSTVTADNQCVVNIDQFVHTTVKSSLQSCVTLEGAGSRDARRECTRPPLPSPTSPTPAHPTHTYVTARASPGRQCCAGMQGNRTHEQLCAYREDSCHGGAPLLLCHSSSPRPELVHDYMTQRLDCSPPTKANSIQSAAGSLPGFSHVGIVPDDATSWWVFSGISRLPLLFIATLLRSSHLYHPHRSQDRLVESYPNLFTQLFLTAPRPFQRAETDANSRASSLVKATRIRARSPACNRPILHAVIVFGSAFAVANYASATLISLERRLNPHWRGSPPAKANRVQSPAGSPDFRKWESCRTMPLVGGSSRRSSVSPTLSFRRRSICTSITLIGSQDLAVKSRPNTNSTYDVDMRVVYKIEKRDLLVMPNKEGYENFAKPFLDKIDVKHIYSEVTFAIGSPFIRPALYAPKPIADLQGNTS
ncbi:hypothetical protein PR048_007497 [Dryococelus australis]|uniref:Uncharacterized protein n=1 Tax=Dryococelus australis TaxID=614101 RepID=A0ABQ9HUD7_9NEOP|nr:hypothetical protein PR048_007497 [Dryococelus australis]